MSTQLVQVQARQETHFETQHWNNSDRSTQTPGAVPQGSLHLMSVLRLNVNSTGTSKTRQDKKIKDKGHWWSLIFTEICPSATSQFQRHSYHYWISFSLFLLGSSYPFSLLFYKCRFGLILVSILSLIVFSLERFWLLHLHKNRVGVLYFHCSLSVCMCVCLSVQAWETKFPVKGLICF